MTIQAVLFDLDGTILDSNELIYQSFKYTFKKYGMHFTREEIKEFNGPPLIETFQRLNPEQADEMVQTYRAHNHKIHPEYVKLYPNVEETLECLLENDIKIGIVTAKMKVAVELGMELTGLDHYFDVVVTLDDVNHSKPHPEPVLLAMKKLQAEPSTTIIVGDNYHDIVAGQNAGIRTAGVAWTHKGEEFLLSYEPTYMLNDMKDLLEIVGV